MTAMALRALLSGGDRRSIARSNEALRLIEANPELAAQLAGLATDADWLISMRAVDLLEKLAHSHPEWVAPHKRLFIGPLADSDKWEIRLQIVRALPLFRWNTRDMPRVIEILRRNADHRQTFVKAWAADSLSTFALENPSLMPAVLHKLEAFEGSDSKALRSRARNIRKRLAEAATSRPR